METVKGGAKVEKLPLGQMHLKDVLKELERAAGNNGSWVAANLYSLVEQLSKNEVLNMPVSAAMETDNSYGPGFKRIRISKTPIATKK